MNTTTRCKLLILSCWLFAGASQAAVVTLLNGDRLTGSVTVVAGGTMTLTTEHMGAIAIPMEQVAAVADSGTVQVTTTAGEEIIGSLTTNNGTQSIVTSTGVRPIALADLDQVLLDYTVRADAEPTWSTTADVGWILTKGNSDTESRTMHIDSIATQGKFEHRGFAYWDTDESEGEATRDTFDAGYDLRYYFRDKWYALGSIGYFKDELKDIDSRITLGAGLGYQFFNHAIASLSTDLGLTMVIEELDGDNESNPALRWGVDYQRWLNPEKVEYFYGHEVLKILDSERGEIYKVNTGIRVHLSDRWYTNARVDMIHETKPPPGSHRTDLTYSLGFGLVF